MTPPRAFISRNETRDDTSRRHRAAPPMIAELQVQFRVSRHDRRRIGLDAYASHRPDAASAATFGNSRLIRKASS